MQTKYIYIRNKSELTKYVYIHISHKLPDTFPHLFLRSPKPLSILADSPVLPLTLAALPRVLHSYFPLCPHPCLSMLDPSSLPERSANSPSHFFKSKDSPISLKLQARLVSLHNVCSLPLHFLGSIVPGKRRRFGKDVLAPSWISEREKLL